jgi:hypothetical protein
MLSFNKSHTQNSLPDFTLVTTTKRRCAQCLQATAVELLRIRPVNNPSWQRSECCPYEGTVPGLFIGHFRVASFISNIALLLRVYASPLASRCRYRVDWSLIYRWNRKSQRIHGGHEKPPK